jgi:hypothetical protein
MTDPVQVVAVLLGGAALIALIGWGTPLPRLATGLTAALLGAAATIAVLCVDTPADEPVRWAAVAAGGLLAVAGGGPLTTVVFDLVDRPGPSGRGPVQRAGEVLRGGAWIGALERLATYVAIVAGWPEGLALVLAVKGLGRYPELRASGEDIKGATAERFIIGTFTSVLWALACAGVVLASG